MGPTTRWVGPETLVDVVLEGCEALALADSGSQVNTMTPEFVQEQGYPVLPLSGLVNYPLHLVGLGGQCTCPLGFMIARLQVKEVAGYDEDVIFPGGSGRIHLWQTGPHSDRYLYFVTSYQCD